MNDLTADPISIKASAYDNSLKGLNTEKMITPPLGTSSDKTRKISLTLLFILFRSTANLKNFLEIEISNVFLDSGL